MAADETGYISGTEVVIDGGCLARWGTRPGGGVSVDLGEQPGAGRLAGERCVHRLPGQLDERRRYRVTRR